MVASLPLDARVGQFDFKDRLLNQLPVCLGLLTYYFDQPAIGWVGPVLASQTGIFSTAFHNQEVHDMFLEDLIVLPGLEQPRTFGLMDVEKDPLVPRDQRHGWLFGWGRPIASLNNAWCLRN